MKGNEAIGEIIQPPHVVTFPRYLSVVVDKFE